MFVPPYSLILRYLDAGPKGGSRNDEVTISKQFLDFLLRRLLDQIEFDEQQYLKCNPDVADAIRRNKTLSAREHFITVGYFEGRIGGTPVHEAWYLSRNPDVAAAKNARKFESGAMQYHSAGALEWREPDPKSAGLVQAWKAVLER